MTDIKKTQDKKGCPPLMLAARYGHKRIARLLIDKGADVNARDKIDKTALMYATEYGHTDIVALLKKAGAKE